MGLVDKIKSFRKLPERFRKGWSTYGMGKGIGSGNRIFLPPCNRSAAITAFFRIFFLPASTPVCCWLINANNKTKLIRVAKVMILTDFIFGYCLRRFEMFTPNLAMKQIIDFDFALTLN